MASLLQTLNIWKVRVFGIVNGLQRLDTSTEKANKQELFF